MSNRDSSVSPHSASDASTNSAPSSQGQLQVSHIVHAAAPTQLTHPEFIKAVEIGGRDGPEPTRYGDWEKRGRCIDF
jgi:hypothetical protein